MLDLNPIAPNINPVKTIIVTFLGDRKSQPFSITIPNWISTGATVGTWHGCWRKMYSPPHRILTCPLNRDHFKRKVSGAMLAECFSKWWLVMRSVWVVLWRLCATTWTCFTIESLQLWTNSKLHETAKSTCQGLPFPQRKEGYLKKTGPPFASIFRCELLVISRIGRSLTWDPDSFFTWNVILSTKDHKLSLKQGSWGEVFG